MEEKFFHDLSEIDTRDVVFFSFSNPFYQGNECNVMETSFKYPEDRVHIIHMIKLAIRLGLDIKFTCENKEIMGWVSDYYNEYKS